MMPLLVRKYISILDYMRERALREGKVSSIVGFYSKLLDCIAQQSPLLGTSMPHDELQYLAESSLFLSYWPLEAFPNQNPYRLYDQHYRRIWERARLEGKLESDFSREQKRLAGNLNNMVRNHGLDYAHYHFEMLLWQALWGGKKEKFLGINPKLAKSNVQKPSANQPAPIPTPAVVFAKKFLDGGETITPTSNQKTPSSIITPAPVLQEKAANVVPSSLPPTSQTPVIPKKNLASGHSVLLSSTANFQAQTSKPFSSNENVRPGPIFGKVSTPFSPLIPQSAVTVPNVPTQPVFMAALPQITTISKASSPKSAAQQAPQILHLQEAMDPNRNLRKTTATQTETQAEIPPPPELLTNSCVVRVGSFLETIAKDYTNLKPLAKAFNCHLRIEQIRGSETYPLRVFVEPSFIRTPPDCSRAVIEANKARRLLGHWGRSDCEEVWGEIERGWERYEIMAVDGRGKKRKL